MPDSRLSTEALLGDVETQLEAVDQHLMEGDALALQGATTQLRQVSLAFARVLEAALSAEVFDLPFRQRIECVAGRLSQQREHLARRNALVERALASLLRPAQAPTYTIPGQGMPIAGMH